MDVVVARPVVVTVPKVGRGPLTCQVPETGYLVRSNTPGWRPPCVSRGKDKGQAYDDGGFSSRHGASSAGDRQVRNHRAPRPGRHGHGLQGPRSVPRPRGRPQDHLARAGRQPRVPGPLPARGPRGRAPAAPEHRHRSTSWATSPARPSSRWSCSRAWTWPRRCHRPERLPLDEKLRVDGRGLPRPRLRAQARRRAPRREAREHPHPHGRQRQAGGLRHRAPGRVDAHPDRACCWARPATWRRRWWRAGASTTAPTCGRSASCSTRCWRAQRPFQAPDLRGARLPHRPRAAASRSSRGCSASRRG